jgi:hypothetical protein
MIIRINIYWVEYDLIYFKLSIQNQPIIKNPVFCISYPRKNTYKKKVLFFFIFFTHC